MPQHRGRKPALATSRKAKNAATAIEKHQRRLQRRGGFQRPAATSPQAAPAPWNRRPY